MSLTLPSEVMARRASEHIRFDLLTSSLMQRYSPAILYRGMLFWVRRQGKKDVLAHFCFLDLFGVKARYSDRGDPIGPALTVGQRVVYLRACTRTARAQAPSRTLGEAAMRERLPDRRGALAVSFEHRGRKGWLPEQRELLTERAPQPSKTIQRKLAAIEQMRSKR